MGKIFFSLFLTIFAMSAKCQTLVEAYNSYALTSHFNETMGSREFKTEKSVLMLTYDNNIFCMNNKCQEIETDVLGYEDGYNYFYSFRLANGWLVLIHYEQKYLKSITIIVGEKEIVYQ